MSNAEQILTLLSGEVVQEFLNKYITCEYYAKELQNNQIHEENRIYLLDRLKEYKDKTILFDDKTIFKMYEKINIKKFKLLNERNGVDLGKQKSLLNEIIDNKILTLLFDSHKKKGVPRSARIIRNVIVHNPSNKTVIEELIERKDSLIKAMDEYIDKVSALVTKSKE